MLFITVLCILSFTSSLVNAQCVAPLDSISAWWPGDGHSQDVIGSEYLILVGDTSYGHGMNGQAFLFDGSGDYAEATGTIGDMALDPFTVEFWMNPNSNGGSGGVVQSYLVGKSHPDGGKGWDIRYFQNQIHVVGVNGWAFNIASAPLVFQGDWYHIALTSTDTLVYLYINGALEGSCSRSTISTTSNPFRVGYNTNYGGLAYDGNLDEVSLYDQALSQNEVLNIYQAGKSGKCKRKQPPGMALGFDGVNSYLEIPGGGGLDGLSQGTIEMWVKWSGTQNASFGLSGCVAARQKDGIFNSHLIGLSVTNPGSAVLRWGPYGQNSGYIDGTSLIGDGRWRHVAISFNSASQIHSLYLDGYLEVSVSKSGSFATDPAIPFTLGGWIGHGSNYSNADMDEVKIWNTVRTVDQIRQDMCQRLLSPFPADLIAYFGFDAGEGTAAVNEQGNPAHDGILRNATQWLPSGAPVGDYSLYDYNPTDDFEVTLGESTGLLDYVTAFAIDDPSHKGLQVYRIDAPFYVPAPPEGLVSLSGYRYFGVFLVGEGQYDVTYNYEGHPEVETESLLRLAQKTDGTDLSWVDSDIMPDLINNTLSKNLETGFEYILGFAEATCVDHAFYTALPDWPQPENVISLMAFYNCDPVISSLIANPNPAPIAGQTNVTFSIYDIDNDDIFWTATIADGAGAIWDESGTTVLSGMMIGGMGQESKTITTGAATHMQVAVVLDDDQGGMAADGLLITVQ